MRKHIRVLCIFSRLFFLFFSLKKIFKNKKNKKNGFKYQVKSFGALWGGRVS